MKRPTNSRAYGAVILLLVAASLFLARPFAHAEAEPLFFDLPGEVTLNNTAVTQAKRVAINWRALSNPETAEIAFNLFDDQLITAVHDRTDTTTSGFVWVGHVAGQESSPVTLSVVDDILIGSITLPETTITIRHDGQSQIVGQIDRRRALEMEGPDVLLPPTQPTAPDTALTEMCEDGKRIDLLVAYTTEARQAQGSTAAIVALINQRVADMNTANKDSGVAFRFRLVHTMETAYRETGSVRADLEPLVTKGDGVLDDVTRARDTYKADLTALVIAEAQQENACGIAYVMQEPSTSFADWAFNVTALDYAGLFFCGDYTLAHEFGHNMGNQHETGSYPIFPYSFGYQSPQGTFRTLMATSCVSGYCPRINQWSNPDVRFAGEPTGIHGAADNARSMDETAVYVANFRPNCSAAAPSDTPTATATATNTATATPTATHTPAPTNTATATATPTNTPINTATATVTPASTTTATPGSTPRPESTAVPPTPSATPKVLQYGIMLPLLIDNGR